MTIVARVADLPTCDILAIGPHPDDVEIACGGTLLLANRAGKSFAIVDCTRGEMGSTGTVKDRDQESANASMLLGVAARSNLRLPDTGLRVDDDATNLLVHAIRATRAEILFAPHERDVHPDHTAAAQLVGRAFFLAGLRNYQPSLGAAHRPRVLLRYPGNQPVEPTFVVDIRDVVDQKADVVRCYRTQLAPPDKNHLVQGLDLLERTQVRERAFGAMIRSPAGEGFCHDGPMAVRGVDWLFN